MVTAPTKAGQPSTLEAATGEGERGRGLAAWGLAVGLARGAAVGTGEGGVAVGSGVRVGEAALTISPAGRG